MKNKIIVLRTLIIIIISLIIGIIIIVSKEKTQHESVEENHFVFSENVITLNDIKIYSLENNNYIESGLIGKDVELSLENSTNEYFKIKDFDNYYIKYNDIEAITTKKTYNDRYKEYILFNYNVETKDKTIFYDEDNNMVYTFNVGYSLPLIIKEEDKYGVEFNNRLLYIKKENSTLIEHHNTDLHNSSGVGVLNYHAFYDENNEEERKNCNTSICHSKAQFKTQLDFLKDNNILTLKMKEVEDYIDGKINLPKSVLITIDDGGREEHGINMLTEYKMYATIFLVTSWYDPNEYYKTDYIELHSHTHDMHNTGECPGGQGGAIKCWSKEKIQADLKQSREMLNNTTYFCYPFYEYNEYSEKMLKEAGFTMAFIGESTKSDNLVHVGSDKLKLRRFVIVTYTKVEDLKTYFNQIK